MPGGRAARVDADGRLGKEDTARVVAYAVYNDGRYFAAKALRRAHAR